MGREFSFGKGLKLPTGEMFSKHLELHIQPGRGPELV